MGLFHRDSHGPLWAAPCRMQRNENQTAATKSRLLRLLFVLCVCFFFFSPCSKHSITDRRPLWVVCVSACGALWLAERVCVCVHGGEPVISLLSAIIDDDEGSSRRHSHTATSRGHRVPVAQRVQFLHSS
jgi:hypothetical protein